MYQNIHYERKTETIHLWDDEKGYLKFDYVPYAYKKCVDGEFVSMYGDKVQKVYNFNSLEPDLFESDVPAETRTLIDLYENEDNVSTGHILLNYDIEVDISEKFPTVADADNEITSIATWDDKSNKYQVLILDKDNLVEDSVKDDVTIKSFETEKELLTHFLQYWESLKPTLLTGWNIDGFDNPYLYNRLKKVFGLKTAKRLSSIGIVYWDKFKERLKIAGISSLDYLAIYKNKTYVPKELPNYRLDTVAKIELGKGKIEYDGNLNDLFKEDINKFVEYNLTDVVLVKELDESLKLIELVITVCHICHVPYELFGLSSKFLEGSVLTYLRRKGVVAQNKPAGGRQKMKELKEDGEQGFEGAYVKDPVAGLYKWIFDLDLTSLYPSIIMSINISPETKRHKVYSHIEPAKPKPNGKKGEMIPEHPAWSSEKFISGKLTKVFLTQDACWEDKGVEDENVISIEDFKSKLKEQNLSVASNGCTYSLDSVGIVPQLLDDWFQQRVEFRKLEKQYGKAGDKEKYKFYNKRQKTQKILLNSMYGVLGLPVFRFYDADNAEAVTLTGQTVIKSSAKMGNLWFNNVLGTDKSTDHCIYIDTDSVV
jgi:DNA polymerase elongation subunit (family B)